MKNIAKKITKPALIRIIKDFDLYTKINIQDYLAKPEAKFAKEYSKEKQKIRKYNI